MRLTLIRHGITEGNVRRLYYGSTDLPLLPEGVEALRLLRAAGGYPVAPRYYTSGMRRAEQTFALLYGDEPHAVLPGTREMRFGDFEMKTYEELKQNPQFRAWCSGDFEENVCPGGGDSWNGMTRRALAALEPLVRSPEDAVVVAHGGVIGGVMYRWFPAVHDHRFAWTPEPGHGYQVTFREGAPVSFRPVPVEDGAASE